MNTCVICGKSREVITLEIEDDNGQVDERYVCKSCWAAIASIAISVVMSELKPLVDELEPVIKFVSDFKELSTLSSKIKDSASELEVTTSEVEDAISKLEDATNKSKDSRLFNYDSSNDEKTIMSLSNEVLAEQLLSFVKEMNLDEDEIDLLDRDTLRLFWKTKGIQHTFGVSAEIDIKIKQVEKLVRSKLDKRVFSASNDELGQELAVYAKKEEGQENGQGVNVRLAAYTFWRNKGIDFRTGSLDVQQRKNEIERLAQEIVDKDFHNYRDQRLEAENKELPKLIQSCVDWARETGRNNITIKDVKYFLLEKKTKLLEATERALYLSANNELKAKKKTT